MTAGIRAMADLKRKHICSHDGCDFSAMYMSQFKRHKNAVHDGVRPFACDYIGCTYMAGQLFNLKNHKNVVHYGLRLFACDHIGCVYTAGKLFTLKNHKNVVHYGLRLFACDHIGCVYTAGELGTLKKHKQTHIRDYVCDRPDCGEAFSNLRSLEVHARMHSAIATKGCEERPIPGVPGYTASSHGHVFNMAGNIMAERIVEGYPKVGVVVDRVRKMYMVHRLVALAFHGPQPDESYTVDHIDRIKTNNNASNLRWATKVEQCANRTRPDKHPAKCRPVVITSASGQVSEFRSVAEAVEALGLPKGSRSRALDTAVQRSRGTWRYNDLSHEGVTYRPIPSSSIGDGRRRLYHGTMRSRHIWLLRPKRISKVEESPDAQTGRRRVPALGCDATIGKPY